MSVTEIAGPIVLFLLMLFVGLELTPADFRRVLAAPRAIVGGTLAQIVLLPAMTWAVVWVLDVNPVFGAGAILVAVAPGAGMSNILAALARANVALSVTLTAVASVLAVVTLPAIASFGMRVFLDDSAPVDIPVAALVIRLGLALLVPISLGMLLRAYYPERADRLGPRLQRVTIAAVVLLVVLAIVFTDQDEISYEGSGVALVAAGVWTLAAMGIGWSVARLLRLPADDRFTFAIEFSARNVAVSTIVAMSALGRLDLTLFSGMYAAIGYPLSAGLVVWRRRRLARASHD